MPVFSSCDFGIGSRQNVHLISRPASFSRFTWILAKLHPLQISLLQQSIVIRIIVLLFASASTKNRPTRSHRWTVQWEVNVVYIEHRWKIKDAVVSSPSTIVDNILYYLLPSTIYKLLLSADPPAPHHVISSTNMTHILLLQANKPNDYIWHGLRTKASMDLAPNGGDSLWRGGVSTHIIMRASHEIKPSRERGRNASSESLSYLVATSATS